MSTHLRHPSVVGDEISLVQDVGVTHAALSARSEYLDWFQHPDGSLESMADRLTAERAALGHALAANALEGEEIETELSCYGPLTVSLACLESLERASQCVWLDDSGRVAMLAERVVTTVSTPAEPDSLPAVLVSNSVPDSVDISGLPSVTFKALPVSGEVRFALRHLAAKLTVRIDPDDDVTLSAWLADVAALLEGADRNLYAALSIRYFAAMRAALAVSDGADIALAISELNRAANRIPRLRSIDPDGVFIEDAE